MWHVTHDDGDQEDLEEHELVEAMQRYEQAPADGLQVEALSDDERFEFLSKN